MWGSKGDAREHREDVAAAERRIRSLVRETPLEVSDALSERVGAKVLLKLENLQHTGSFKVRGASNKILSLGSDLTTIVATSSGNHGAAVAYVLRELGGKGLIFVPTGASPAKVENIRHFGAEVAFFGDDSIETETHARGWAATRGWAFVSPYNDSAVVAGQGTLGLEILEQCPEVRTVAIPVGGGGVAAGVTVAVKSADPSIAVVGVQAEAVAAYPASLAAGHPIRVQPTATMADGIAVCLPGDIPFGIISGFGVHVLTVSEESLSRALLLCLERAKQVVEPAGAAAVAGLMENAGMFEPPVVAVLSGGNIDPLLLAKVLRHGLAAAGRYLTFRCRIPDRPGALASLLGAVAGLGANVLDVMHERVTPRLRVGEVEVLLQVETRGPAHCDYVISELRQAGYHLMFR